MYLSTFTFVLENLKLKMFQVGRFQSEEFFIRKTILKKEKEERKKKEEEERNFQGFYERSHKKPTRAKLHVQRRIRELREESLSSSFSSTESRSSSMLSADLREENRSPSMLSTASNCSTTSEESVLSEIGSHKNKKSVKFTV